MFKSSCDAYEISPDPVAIYLPNRDQKVETGLCTLFTSGCTKTSVEGRNAIDLPSPIEEPNLSTTGSCTHERESSWSSDKINTCKAWP
jgi:hypothetical protein